MALEAKGRLIRIKEMDQDKYQATGFAYRAVMRASANLTIVLNNLQRAFSKLRDQLELDC